jgi:hypothetical protein
LRLCFLCASKVGPSAIVRSGCTLGGRLSDDADNRGHVQMQFVELRRSLGQQAEVVLGSRRMLRVTETIDPEVLLRLVVALEQQT